MGKSLTFAGCVLLMGLESGLLSAAELDDPDPAYYHTGELAADCRSCHSNRAQTGVHTIPSLVNSGAQLGIVHTLPAGVPSPHSARTVKWKTADETYRRLVEFLEE